MNANRSLSKRVDENIDAIVAVAVAAAGTAAAAVVVVVVETRLRALSSITPMITLMIIMAESRSSS